MIFFKQMSSMASSLTYLMCSDIEPMLFRIAQSAGKTKAELRVYDPYYCEGSMLKHMAKLGFTSVYNRNEDFYKTIK